MSFCMTARNWAGRFACTAACGMVASYSVTGDAADRRAAGGREAAGRGPAGRLRGDVRGVGHVAQQRRHRGRHRVGRPGRHLQPVLALDDLADVGVQHAGQGDHPELVRAAAEVQADPDRAAAEVQHAAGRPARTSSSSAARTGADPAAAIAARTRPAIAAPSSAAPPGVDGRRGRRRRAQRGAPSRASAEPGRGATTPAAPGRAPQCGQAPAASARGARLRPGQPSVSSASRLRVRLGSSGMPGPIVVASVAFCTYRPLEADGLSRRTSSSAAA